MARTLTIDTNVDTLDDAWPCVIQAIDSTPFEEGTVMVKIEPTSILDESSTDESGFMCTKMAYSVMVTGTLKEQ